MPSHDRKTRGNYHPSAWHTPEPEPERLVNRTVQAVTVLFWTLMIGAVGAFIVAIWYGLI